MPVLLVLSRNRRELDKSHLLGSCLLLQHQGRTFFVSPGLMPPRCVTISW
jgi:hypothetical protein